MKAENILLRSQPVSSMPPGTSPIWIQGGASAPVHSTGIKDIWAKVGLSARKLVHLVESKAPDFPVVNPLDLNFGAVANAIAGARAMAVPSVAEPTGAIKPHKKVLMINLIAADCNLTRYQYQNIVQQQKVGSDENTHLVAYIDVGPNKNPVDGQWSGCRGYYINQDPQADTITSEVFGDYGDHVDMSNPKQLRDFVLDAINKFPADQVVIVYNDHGGGEFGEMADDHDGSFASISGIAWVNAEVKKACGKPLMAIHDACMENTIEVMYENRASLDFMVGSQETIGGSGLPYTFILGGKLSEAIAQLQKSFKLKAARNLRGGAHEAISAGLKEFAQSIIGVARAHPNGVDTLAAEQLDGGQAAFGTAGAKEPPFDCLIDTIKPLAAAIRATSDKDAVRQGIEASESYGGGYPPYNDIRDLYDMCQQIAKRTSDPKLKAATAAVIAQLEPGSNNLILDSENNAKTHPRSHGISIFCGSPKTQNYGASPFATETGWGDALASLQSNGTTEEEMRVWPDGSPRTSKEPQGPPIA